jgi:heme exporter protein A
MLSLRGYQISHTYRYHKVLKEISLELNPGECFVLFGPNGAGKTTLMKILATLLRPTSGSIEIMGKDTQQNREEARRYLFFIGHGTFLYDDLTVIENIEFTMGLRGETPSFSRIRDVLDRVGIGPFALQKSRYLSAGMQRRLALAKALLANPNLLLLDEPYVSLDEKGMEMMNDCIREFLGKGTAVLMSSHDRAKAAEVASCAGILHNKTLREISVKELGYALF